MATDDRRHKKLNGNSISLSERGDLFLSPRDPEVARAEVARWYYQITPPSSYGLQYGVNYDWPGPEYETVEPEPDARHYKKRSNGKADT